MGLGKTVEMVGCILANPWKPREDPSTSRPREADGQYVECVDRRDADEEAASLQSDGGQCLCFWILICASTSK